MLLTALLSCGLIAAPTGAAATGAPGTAADAALRARILRAAESKIGYTEPGDYCSVFGPCEQWCSLFLTWAWERAGVEIPRYGFVGYVWDWSQLHASVIAGHGGDPQPGDAVMYGTGPLTVYSAPHVGIVEAVYPNYLVTIEGDVIHGVRRLVIARSHPQAAGEPGPIWGYAQPVASAAKKPYVIDPEVSTPFRTTVVHPVGTEVSEARLLRTIRALRPFQHLPYRGDGYRIAWNGVDAKGQVEVTVTSKQDFSVAEADWTAFVRRYGGAASAYEVTYDAPPDPLVAELPPTITGSPAVGQTLVEGHADWSDAPSTYAYQWLLCNISGQDCVPIPGATGQQFTVTTADLYQTLAVQETATDATASVTSTSATSAIVGY